MTMQNCMFIVLDGDSFAINGVAPQLPGKIAQCFVGYLHESELHRPVSMRDSLARCSVTHISDTGVLVQNRDDQTFLTGASHGFGDDGTVYQLQADQSKRFVGKVETSFPDIALVQLHQDVDAVNVSFEDQHGNVPAFSRLLGEQPSDLSPQSKFPTMVHFDSPFTGVMSGTVVAHSMKIESQDASDADVRFVPCEWLFTGQMEGNGNSPRALPGRRWGSVYSSDDKLKSICGLPTTITSPITAEQLDAYLMQFRIQEITLKLQARDYINMPASKTRCPSPEPEYDYSGRRTNTREQRHRKTLEDERHILIEAALKTIPNYHPPKDYRQPSSFSTKVYIPVAEFPSVNFIGQILSPRGSSLKALNQKAEASIVLRGKGSIKEGRGHGRGSRSITSAQHLGEPLHCLILAKSPSRLQKAKELVQDAIDAATTPDNQNEKKRQQLRELAVLNGTFRDDENKGKYRASSSLAS
ncbi:hypothetical protein CP532_2120 [Ophiocordyceps camponoti-leonardi (nom. inval.)]|nr:hypothetical protein CP532_2120 [Ophiocordyceps camponoti-leonardi (nom. inval.)]